MRCSSCQAVLTRGEMMFDLPDGTMNDICWTCQGIIDHPESCVDREYQFEELTEKILAEIITPAKPLND